MDFHYGLLIFHLVIPISLWNNMDYPIFVIPLYDPTNHMYSTIISQKCSMIPNIMEESRRSRNMIPYYDWSISPKRKHVNANSLLVAVHTKLHIHSFLKSPPWKLAIQHNRLRVNPVATRMPSWFWVHLEVASGNAWYDGMMVDGRGGLFKGMKGVKRYERLAFLCGDVLKVLPAMRMFWMP